MNKVPKMITTKDLDYLADIFNWNFLAAKKAYDSANLVSDENIKKELDECYEMHKNICKQIIKMLG